MKHFAILMIVGVSALIAISGCKKKSDCSFLFPDMVYIGFTEQETDTMILRRYEKDAHFTKMIDTVLLPKADIMRTIIGKDSVILSSLSEKFSLFKHFGYNYDWEIIFPGVPDFPIYVTDIKARIVQEKAPSTHCHSFITSVIFHDTNYQWDAWLPDGYRVYAKKGLPEQE